MKWTKSALALACGLSVFYACSKRGSSQLVPDSQQSARLTVKPWYFESAGIDFDRDGDIDFAIPAGTVPDCTLDDAWTFFGDGTGLAKDSTLRCDTLVAPKPFAWSFANNEQALDLSGAARFFGRQGRFRVWALNDTALSVARDTLVPLPMFPQPVNASVIINLEHR